MIKDFLDTVLDSERTHILALPVMGLFTGLASLDLATGNHFIDLVDALHLPNLLAGIVYSTALLGVAFWFTDRVARKLGYSPSPEIAEKM